MPEEKPVRVAAVPSVGGFGRLFVLLRRAEHSRYQHPHVQLLSLPALGRQYRPADEGGDGFITLGGRHGVGPVPGSPDVVLLDCAGDLEYTVHVLPVHSPAGPDDDVRQQDMVCLVFGDEPLGRRRFDGIQELSRGGPDSIIAVFRNYLKTIDCFLDGFCALPFHPNPNPSSQTSLSALKKAKPDHRPTHQLAICDCSTREPMTPPSHFSIHYYCPGLSPPGAYGSTTSGNPSMNSCSSHSASPLLASGLIRSDSVRR